MIAVKESGRVSRCFTVASAWQRCTVLSEYESKRPSFVIGTRLMFDLGNGETT